MNSNKSKIIVQKNREYQKKKKKVYFYRKLKAIKEDEYYESESGLPSWLSW